MKKAKTLAEAVARLKKDGIEVEKSILKEFKWFIEAPADELTGDNDHQEQGTHFQRDEQIIAVCNDICVEA